MLVPVLNKNMCSLQDICDENVNKNYAQLNGCANNYKIDTFNAHLDYFDLNNDKIIN